MDIFSQIEIGAHIGAMGNNPLQEPTNAQQIAGNYKLGRITLHGFDIAIENPRGTIRSGVNKKTGKAWSNRMAAHYGYLTGTKGADGDGLDVFVGHVPESKRVFVINQVNPESGQFDEHKLMMGFDDHEQAKNAYKFSYDRGWDGIGSMIETTLSQIKWWTKHGDMKSPLSTSALPREGYEEMIKWTSGNDGGLPIGSSLDTVLYKIRQSDHGEGLVFDSLELNDILEDADERITLDALVIPFAQLSRRMNVLLDVMARAGEEVKPLSMQISEPFKQRGVANVAAVFELSDGQTIAAFFHNPDVNPSKLASGDEMISWKWMLNKKDITIIAAPEKGVDLNVREVARRVMRLAERNSASFRRVNAKRSERMASIAALKESVASKEVLLTELQSELQAKKAVKEKALRDRASQAVGVPDIAYRSVDDMFTAFYPNTPAGEDAWKKISAQTDGTGKVLNSHVESTVQQLREAGYTVSKDASTPVKNDDELLAELTVADAEPADAPENEKKIAVNGTFGDLSISEQLTAMGILFVERDGIFFLGKNNKATGNTVCMQYTNNKQADDAVEKLRVAGFAAHGTTQHPFRIVITGAYGEVAANDVVAINAGFANPPRVERVLTLDERIAAASNIGKQALIDGDSRAPAQREDMVALIAGSDNNALPILEAYTSAWNAQNAIEQAGNALNKIESTSVVVVAGNELGDFPTTAEGKRQLRIAAAEAYSKSIESGSWVACPSLGADVELRSKGLKKVISNSADVRKLKIIPHIKDLIGKSNKVGDEKPNYDKSNSPNIVGYQTMRALVTIGEDSLAVRFVFGRDDKGAYHYDHTIHPMEAVFDSANENELATASSNSSTGGNLGCTCDRSIASEPTSLLPSDSSEEHRTDEILVNNGQERKQTLDSAFKAGEVVNLFIEGEPAEDTSDDATNFADSDALIQAAINDPIGNRAWELNKDVIKGLTEDAFQSICAKLTDENYHQENLIFMAKRVGTDGQIIEAIVLNKNADRIEPDDYLSRRDKLSQSLHDAQTAAFKVLAVSMEPAEEQNQPSVPTKFDDQEQSYYRPFNASSVKMPTAQQLGIGAASKNILRLFKDANEAQIDGWTNGHILDVFSEPPLIAEAQNAIEEGGSGSVGWIDYGRVEQVVNKSKSGGIALSPVCAYEYVADEESKRYSAIASLQGKSAVDIKSVLLGNDAEGLALHINKFYYAYFARTYKGAEFFTDKDGGNVLVKHRGTVVGVLMPIKLKGTATTRQDHVENLARAKQASAASANSRVFVVQNSKFQETDIKIGDMVSKDGEDYVVSGTIQGGISAKRTASEDGGVINERTVLLRGDDAIGARVEYLNKNASSSSAAPLVSPLDTFESGGGEAWQVPRAKWVEIMRGHMASLGQVGEDSDFESYHQSVVKQALDEGKDVPAEVLMDYPNMKAETLEQREARYAQAEANLAKVISAAAGTMEHLPPKSVTESPVADDSEAGSIGLSQSHVVNIIDDPLAHPVANPVPDEEQNAGGAPADLPIQQDLAPVNEPDASLERPTDHTEDIAFMQSVIDGKADIWDAGLAGKLEVILGRVSGDQALHSMWLKALKSYSSQALIFTQKTLSG